MKVDGTAVGAVGTAHVAAVGDRGYSRTTHVAAVGDRGYSYSMPDLS